MSQSNVISAPDSIWITNRDKTSLSVAWSPVTDNRLHSYNVRLNGSYAGWTQPDVHSFTFDNLQEGTSYTLGVLSVEVPAQVYSGDVSVNGSTMSANLPRPENVWITEKTTSSVTIAWTPVSDDRLHSYNLRLDNEYTGWTEPGVSEFTFENLNPDTKYNFGVLSVEVPAQIYSATTSVSTSTDSLDLIKAPSDVWIIEYDANSVTVGWTPVQDVRLQSYNLALDGVYAGWTSPDTTQFTFEGLFENTEYSFGVRAVEVPATTYSSLTTNSFTLPVGICGKPERFHSAKIDGEMHAFVDSNNRPQSLKGVNVRSPIRSNNTPRYNQNEFNAIATKGFDHIRLPLDWHQFEIQSGQFDAAKLTALDTVVQLADNAGLGVILDPIHLKNDRSENFWGVPAWAWGSVNPETTKVFSEIDDHALAYLEMITERYCDNPTVIAIDLVNEPREPNRVSLAQGNQALVAMYKAWLARLRAIDPNKLFLIEPFYGATAVSSSTLSQIGTQSNVVWSVHDYYTGEGSPRNGFTSSGRTTIGPRTESWDSSENYPISDRSNARIGMTEHILVHRDSAANAGLAIHVGEFGIPDGWNGKSDFLCDKSIVYGALDLPTTAWVWNKDVDYGFGLWHPESGWVHWADSNFNPDCQ